MIYMSGLVRCPWGPGPVLDGSYTDRYPDKSIDEEGPKKFFKMFSFLGTSAATAPECRAPFTRVVSSVTSSHACGPSSTTPS